VSVPPLCSVLSQIVSLQWSPSLASCTKNMHAWRRRWRHKENKLTEEEEQKTVPKSASLSTRAAVAGGRAASCLLSFHKCVTHCANARRAAHTVCLKVDF
jgi:hypothetical protein